MPEGDSIHRLAATLSDVLLGRTVRAFSARALGDAASSVAGHAVVAVEARGKNLLVRFDDGRSLHVHLRMLGRVHVLRAGQRDRSAAPELALEVDGATVVGRRLPVVRLLTARAEARAPDLATLGPDLLGASFDEAQALRNLQRLGDRPIGDALLVQRAVAGIGNVYKSEVLFLERVNPHLPAGSLPPETLGRLLSRARLLLRANLGPGPRRTRSSLSGPRLWVYRRSGKPCLRCGATIERILQGATPGRSTYLCPACQK